jgi:hypothetical protein
MGLDRTIISLLRLSGMTGGAVLGIKYGDKIRQFTLVQFPVLRRYHSAHIQPLFRNSVISESEMTSVVGCLGGIMIGYYGWIATLPVCLYILCDQNPDTVERVRSWLRTR